MLLYWILFSFFAYSAVKNWKATTIVWIPFSMLFDAGICLKYTSPALSFILAVNLLLIILYYWKEKSRKDLNQKTFLFRPVFRAYLFSYGVSMLFSIVPFVDVLMNTIQYFINTFVIIALFDKALKSKEDIALFVKASLIVFVPIFLLGLFETIFHDNPWLDWVYLTAPSVDYLKGKMYYVPAWLSFSEDLSMRFGMVRCYSFFSIHIAFGCASVLYMFLFLHLMQAKVSFLTKQQYFYPFIVVLLLACIILSNSKTPFVGFPFFVLSAIPLGKLMKGQTLMFLLICVLGGMIAYTYNENIFNNFISLFDKNLMEEGGGSSTSLRERQFEVGLSMFAQNPLFGNGVNSIGYMMRANDKYADLLGSESSWLKILPERGIVGVVVYLFLYSYMYQILKKSMGKKSSMLFLMGMMGMETATGFMSSIIYMPIIIVIHRIHELELQVNLKCKK